MANVLYPLGKQNFISGNIDLVNDDIRAVLVTSAYTYSAAHNDLADVTGIEEQLGAGMTGKSVTNGVFDAIDITFSAATGSACNAVIIYLHTGTDATSLLIAYIDTASGLPVTLNGGDVQVLWNASGIFAL